jgi:hypothetical protein
MSTPEDRTRRLRECGGLLGVCRSEYRCEVLCVGEQANDIKVVLSDEVVPASSIELSGADGVDRRGEPECGLDDFRGGERLVVGEAIGRQQHTYRHAVDQASRYAGRR